MSAPCQATALGCGHDMILGVADQTKETTGAGNGAPTAFGGRRSVLRRAAAAVTAGTLMALVACDLWLGATRAWWARHSFTGDVVSSLLVLGVTALIFDEVVARRNRKERAVSVAVQGLIVYAQARRTYAAIAATAEPGEGAAEAKANGAPAELQSLANMLLVASPALFDDPEARLFLEAVQRLTGSMYRALSAASISSLRRPGQDNLALLGPERSRVDARIKPLAARIPDQDRALFGEQSDLVAPGP
jgi:hypothetical protein